MQGPGQSAQITTKSPGVRRSSNSSLESKSNDECKHRHRIVPSRTMVPRGHSLLFSIVLLANCLFTVALAQATAAIQTAPAATPSLADVNPGNSHYKYVGCYNETTGFEEAGNVRALAGGSMVSQFIPSPPEHQFRPPSLFVHPTDRLSTPYSQFADDTMTVAKCLNFCGSVQYAGLEYQRYMPPTS
jgi:hypothetical protein